MLMRSTYYRTPRLSRKTEKALQLSRMHGARRLPSDGIAFGAGIDDPSEGKDPFVAYLPLHETPVHTTGIHNTIPPLTGSFTVPTRPSLREGVKPIPALCCLALVTAIFLGLCFSQMNRRDRAQASMAVATQSIEATKNENEALRRQLTALREDGSIGFLAVQQGMYYYKGEKVGTLRVPENAQILPTEAWRESVGKTQST